jgi:hypothetical protein
MSLQELEDRIDKLELSGAGICALSNLIALAGDRADENAMSGIAYLLDIVGESIMDHSCKAREIIYQPHA